MCGETEFVAPLVERFTAYHRRSHVCKTGVGDVLIGAAATIADYNGIPHPSHIRDKLNEHRGKEEPREEVGGDRRVN